MKRNVLLIDDDKNTQELVTFFLDRVVTALVQQMGAELRVGKSSTGGEIVPSETHSGVQEPAMLHVSS